LLVIAARNTVQDLAEKTLIQIMSTMELVIALKPDFALWTTNSRNPNRDLLAGQNH
jgi:hypothetical protein